MKSKSKNVSRLIVAVCCSAWSPFLVAQTAVPFGREIIVETLEIKEGVYQLGEDPVYVRRLDPKGDRVTLRLDSGVTLEKGKIIVDQCDFSGKGDRLVGVGIEADWSSKVSFEDSVFEGCLFKKESGRGYDRFSAKFVFENCVFTDSFFSYWSHKDTGVKANKCTFSRVVFKGYKYKIDATSEVGYRDEHGLEDCHFVDCTVPVSVLLFCESCSFERCKFLDDSADFKVAEAMDVSLDLVGDESPFGLEDTAKVRFKARESGRSRGSRLDVPASAAPVEATPAEGGEVRTWTNTDGRKIEAGFVGVESGAVLLQMGDKEVSYPRNKLGVADVAYVDDWLDSNINWRSLAESRRLALDQALVVSGRQITEEELAQASEETRASYTVGRKSFGVFNERYGEKDVLQLHPESPEKPARVDFSGITGNAKGILELKLHDHRLGDSAFAVLKDGVAVAEGVLDADEWRIVEVPFDQSRVELIISTDDDWRFEFTYITYSFR